VNHFLKKNFKNFLHNGPHKNVWGENVCPGPAVALDGPEDNLAALITCRVSEKDAAIEELRQKLITFKEDSKRQVSSIVLP